MELSGRRVLTNLIESVLLENHVNTAPGLTAKCTYGDTVLLALSQFFGKEAKVMIECQPVMSSSFLSDTARLWLLMKQFNQGSQAPLRMLEPKEVVYLSASCIQQTNLAGILPNINTYRDHKAHPKAYLCDRVVPGSIQGTYGLVRYAWPSHNLLICSPSQERGGILPCEAFASRRLNAAPTSHTIQSTLRSMGTSISNTSYKEVEMG